MTSCTVTAAIACVSIASARNVLPLAFTSDPAVLAVSPTLVLMIAFMQVRYVLLSKHSFWFM